MHLGYKILDNHVASVFEQNYFINDRSIKNAHNISFYRENKFLWSKSIKADYLPSYWQCDNYCYFYYDDKLEVVEKSTGKLIKSFNSISIRSFKSNYFIQQKKTEGRKRNITLFAIEDELCLVFNLKNVGRAIFFNHGKKLFSSSVSEIKFYSPTDSWQVSYDELTGGQESYIYSKIIVKNDKLFFTLVSEMYKGLFVLDIETGKVISKYKGASFQIFEDGEYIYTTRYDNILCRVHAVTLEYEEWDCDALIQSEGYQNIQHHVGAAFNGQFYFTQIMGVESVKLGVLDWEKRALVYKHDFAPENGGVGSVQVTDDRFFVHMQDNTLHIFEREASV